MSMYSGIDLHSNNLVLSILDEGDEVVFERRLRTRLDEVLEALAPYRDELASVAVESTYNGYWLIDGLVEAGYTTLLVNPTQVVGYSGLKYSDDRHDSRHLAHLSRLGILPTGWICPSKERGTRDLLRCRSRLVQQRTSLVQSMQCVICRELGETPSAREVKSIEILDRLEDLPDRGVRMQIESRFAVVVALNEQIKSLEKIVDEEGRERPEYRWLRTIPGVGSILALTILYETGSIARFQRVGQYASYCRCVPSQRLSNGKLKGSGNRKNGNGFLSWAFSEAAHFARRYDERAQRFHERKLRQDRHRMVADRALAHKMARAAYYVQRDQVAYDSKRLFG